MSKIKLRFSQLFPKYRSHEWAPTSKRLKCFKDGKDDIREKQQSERKGTYSRFATKSFLGLKYESIQTLIENFSLY